MSFKRLYNPLEALLTHSGSQVGNQLAGSVVTEQIVDERDLNVTEETKNSNMETVTFHKFRHETNIYDIFPSCCPPFEWRIGTINFLSRCPKLNNSGWKRALNGTFFFHFLRSWVTILHYIWLDTWLGMMERNFI